MPDELPKKEMPEKKARQGRLGMPVLAVLVAALVLAAIAWWGAEIYGVLIEPEQTVGEPDSATESVEDAGGGEPADESPAPSE